jgi:hypothetical protein
LGRRKMHTRFWWGDLEKKTLGRLRRRWEDNIKMELNEIG